MGHHSKSVLLLRQSRTSGKENNAYQYKRPLYVQQAIATSKLYRLLYFDSCVVEAYLQTCMYVYVLTYQYPLVFPQLGQRK